MAGDPRRRAIIIGGGIGGLAAAVALRPAERAVAVYERAAELREVGAGLILWPNAMKALGMLGGHGDPPRLAEAVRTVSRPSGGAALRTWRGEPRGPAPGARAPAPTPVTLHVRALIEGR